MVYSQSGTPWSKVNGHPQEHKRQMNLVHIVQSKREEARYKFIKDTKSHNELVLVEIKDGGGCSKVLMMVCFWGLVLVSQLCLIYDNHLS